MRVSQSRRVKMASLWSRLFGPSVSDHTKVPGATLAPGLGGGPPTVVYPSGRQVFPETPWYPSMDDVVTARQQDRAYGDRATPYLGAEQGARFRDVPFGLGMHTASNGTMNRLPRVPLSKRAADANMRGYLGAQESALSALGFDPDKVVTTTSNKDVETTLAGLYSPKQDAIWLNHVDPSAHVHEAFHRGMTKIRKFGNMPDRAKNFSEEELVRAFMLKHFGPIEMQDGATAGNAQVKDTQRALKNIKRFNALCYM